MGSDGIVLPTDDVDNSSSAPGVFFGAVGAEEVAEGKPKITGSGLRTAKELFAVPTREELTQLKETQQLFKTNLFRMQVCYFNYETSTTINPLLFISGGRNDAVTACKG